MKKVVFLIALFLIFTVGCGKKSEQEMFPGESGEVTGESEVATDIGDLTPQAEESQAVSSLSTVFVKPSAREIQTALKNAGLYEGEIDGVIGPKTKKAIEDFQMQNNLKVDGKVGPKTWEKLKLFLNQAE
jgi:peptidoglycan hydrolase-like protein with peptidoglycan-binding domain